MLLPNRHGSSNEYRYGFQGQEVDTEIKGDGNSVNYKYRMHDPRVGRFFAVDPLTTKYPHYTPYSFSGNQVISAIELEGLEEHSLYGDDYVNPALPVILLEQSFQSARTGFTNFVIRAWEAVITDNYEGGQIRKYLVESDISIADDVTNEMLGRVYQFKAVAGGEATIDFEKGLAGDLKETAFSSVDVVGFFASFAGGGGPGGLAAKTGMSPTSILGQLAKLNRGSRTITKKSLELLEITKDFKNVTFNVSGARKLILDKAGFLHINGRHNKKFFIKESEKANQSFFSSTDPNEIVDTLSRFIKANKSKVDDIISGKSKSTSFTGELDGKEFQLGLRKDRASIGQFFEIE